MENRVGRLGKHLDPSVISAEGVSARESYDYVMGETFSGDTVTLKEVLGNEYLPIHELVKTSELKKKSLGNGKHVIIDSKTVIYNTHLTAIETELAALKQFKESVLENDPNLPGNQAEG